MPQSLNVKRYKAYLQRQNDRTRYASQRDQAIAAASIYNNGEQLAQAYDSQQRKADTDCAHLSSLINWGDPALQQVQA